MMFRIIISILCLSVTIMDSKCDSCSRGCPLNRFNFPGGQQITDYIRIKSPIPAMESMTVCAWLSPHLVSSVQGPILSYATSQSPNTFLLFITSNSEFRVGLHGEVIGETLKINVRTHMCVVTETSVGVSTIYINGAFQGNRKFSNKYEIHGGGALLLGQEQDSLMGKFDQNQAFSGIIENFMIWERGLSASEVWTLYNNKCACPGNYLIYLAMEFIQLHGRVTALPTEEC